MDPDFEKIARNAGFIFWDKDEKPEPTIDWSSEYTEDLENFYNLTLQKSSDIAYALKHSKFNSIEMRDDPVETEFDTGYLQALDDFIKIIKNFQTKPFTSSTERV